jgi:PAS domain S-box-containing protein
MKIMNIYFTIYNTDGTQKYFSENITNILGYSKDDLYGKNAYDFFHPIDLKQISASHAMIIEFTSITSAIYRMRHKNGTYIWVRSYSETIGDEIISLTKKLTMVEILLFKLGFTKSITNKSRCESKLK